MKRLSIFVFMVAFIMLACSFYGYGDQNICKKNVQ